MTTRAIAPSDVLVSEVGQELVLLNLKDERYFGLDDVGAGMWKAVTTSPSLQAAFDNLLTQYDVAPETLSADLLRWVEELVKHGLLEVSSG